MEHGAARITIIATPPSEALLSTIIPALLKLQICVERNIVHSSQLRKKTETITKAMSEVWGRAKEATSETISRLGDK